MRRRIVTLATCGVLIGSVGATAGVAVGQPVEQGLQKKCAKLYEKYLKAVDKGNDAKAEKLLRKMNRKGCAG